MVLEAGDYRRNGGGTQSLIPMGIGKRPLPFDKLFVACDANQRPGVFPCLLPRVR
jgi:hypothetical protein